MIYLLSILSGVLLSLSTPPLHTGPLIWIALVPMFIAILKVKSYRQAWLIGSLASLVFHGFLFFGVKNYSFWIYLLLLPLYSIPYAILAMFTLHIHRESFHPLTTSIVIASFWLLFEKILNILSLPYCIGLTLYQSSWAGSASVIGSSGLSSLIVCANALLAMILLTVTKRQRPFRLIIVSSIAWLSIVWTPFLYGWIYSTYVHASDSSLNVAIVQPNWNPERYVKAEQNRLWREISDLIEKAAVQSRADLILLPENFGIYLGNQRYLDDLKDLPPIDIVIGGVDYSPDRSFAYNSVYHIRPGQGILSVYQKSGLIPLVENAYSAPKESPRYFSIGGYRLAPLICFESLLDERVREQAADSHGLVLLANEAWFEAPFLPFTYLASLVMRSIEYGRPVVMAGNTISMFSDAQGRFETTPYRKAEIANFTFHPQKIKTPFSKFGHTLLYLAGFVLFGTLAIRRI